MVEGLPEASNRKGFGRREGMGMRLGETLLLFAMTYCCYYIEKTYTSLLFALLAEFPSGGAFTFAQIFRVLPFEFSRSRVFDDTDCLFLIVISD